MDYEEEDVEAPEAAKGEAQASGMAGASRGAAPQRSAVCDASAATFGAACLPSAASAAARNVSDSSLRICACGRMCVLMPV